tara:strand:+ start:1552 stop:1860 length:309 start_codon:yes stop_codon:yes gene_type:complete
LAINAEENICYKLSILHKKEKMGSLAISNKILDKYFGYLKNLDNTAKKNLIIKLIKSIETKSDKTFDIKSIFGAWEDNRTSDEIISEIKSSRIEKRNTESLE